MIICYDYDFEFKTTPDRNKHEKYVLLRRKIIPEQHSRRLNITKVLVDFLRRRTLNLTSLYIVEYLLIIAQFFRAHSNLYVPT